MIRLEELDLFSMQYIAFSLGIIFLARLAQTFVNILTSLLLQLKNVFPIDRILLLRQTLIIIVLAALLMPPDPINNVLRGYEAR